MRPIILCPSNFLIPFRSLISADKILLCLSSLKTNNIVLLLWLSCNIFLNLQYSIPFVPFSHTSSPLKMLPASSYWNLSIKVISGLYVAESKAWSLDLIVVTYWQHLTNWYLHLLDILSALHCIVFSFTCTAAGSQSSWGGLLSVGSTPGWHPWFSYMV